MNRESGEKFLTRETVADRLDVSIRSVDRWIRDGDLKAHKFGRSVRILENELAAFTARSRML